MFMTMVRTPLKSLESLSEKYLIPSVITSLKSQRSIVQGDTVIISSLIQLSAEIIAWLLLFHFNYYCMALVFGAKRTSVKIFICQAVRWQVINFFLKIEKRENLWVFAKTSFFFFKVYRLFPANKSYKCHHTVIRIPSVVGL